MTIYEFLSQFSLEDYKKYEKPFFMGNYVYSTDGRIALRILKDNIDDLSRFEEKDFPAILNLNYWDFFDQKDLDWRGLEFGEKENFANIEITCKNCNGAGRSEHCEVCFGNGGHGCEGCCDICGKQCDDYSECFECNGKGGGEDCRECKRKGQITGPFAYKIGNFYFSTEYLTNLVINCDPIFVVHQNPLPVRFKFQGISGEALIMEIKPTFINKEENNV